MAICQKLRRNPWAVQLTNGLIVVDGDRQRTGGADRTIVQVAVGVLINADGAFLLATRPMGKAYAGYWEFPGGKVELGETVAEALCRELKEELGVDLLTLEAWKTQMVDYPHALVQLHFYKIRNWSGAIAMLEGQISSWQHHPVTVSPILPGAIPVLGWLFEERGNSQ